MSLSLWELKKYLDPKFKFVVLHVAIDDEDDEPWTFHETEQQAKDQVKVETEAYGNVPHWQFRYEEI